MVSLFFNNHTGFFNHSNLKEYLIGVKDINNKHSNHLKRVKKINFVKVFSSKVGQKPNNVGNFLVECPIFKLYLFLCK